MWYGRPPKPLLVESRQFIVLTTALQSDISRSSFLCAAAIHEFTTDIICCIAWLAPEPYHHIQQRYFVRQHALAAGGRVCATYRNTAPGLFIWRFPDRSLPCNATSMTKKYMILGKQSNISGQNMLISSGALVVLGRRIPTCTTGTVLNVAPG